ncbi:MAG: chemotaxis protein CheX [Spirochaetales bacterium]|nr:chemotaxis protein CheX [Spirochaetales bacterium]
MRNNNIRHFFEAALEVFRELGFSEAQYAGEERQETFPEGIIANVGLTGDYHGFLVFKSDIVSAGGFVNKMLSNLGMNTTETGFGEFKKEAIGEIVNQVSGRAVMKLSECDIDCNITPPTILTGNNLFFDMRQFSVFSSQILHGEFGTINITVGLK